MDKEKAGSDDSLVGGGRLGGLSPDRELDGLEVVGLDFETTGLSAWRGDEVCEVGVVRAVRDQVESLLGTFVYPGKDIPQIVQDITGIRDEDVADAPLFGDILPRIYETIGERPIVLHNAPFDLAFVKQGADAHGLPMLENLAIDTLLISRFLNRARQKNSLVHVSRRLKIDGGRSHRATDDAATAARVFHALLPQLAERGIRTVGELVEARLAMSAEQFVAAPSSVVLDMLTRAVERGDIVEMGYSRGAGTTAQKYRVKAVGLVRDQEFVAELVRGGAEESSGAVAAEQRTFRVLDIMTLRYQGVTFVGPWATPEMVEQARQ